jgi:hypothetical protein
MSDEPQLIYQRDVSVAQICSSNHSKYEDKSISMLIFIGNALDDGWSVKKNNNGYVFSKKHNGRTKYFSSKYLEQFVIKELNAELPPLP